MRNFNTLVGWPALLTALALFQTSAADSVSPAEPQSGALLLRMANGYESATLLNTDVNIEVNGIVARVSVMQEFRNEGADWVEGVYVFPLPGKSAVDRMRLYIGDRFIEGEIREKEQARKEYEQAKQEGKKTSLVEQQRANLFTTSVANVAPGETVIIEIEYLETVAYDEGTFSLRFPMTLTPRYIPGEAVTERAGSGWAPDTTEVGDASLITPPMTASSSDHKVSLQVRLNAGLPLAIVASRYHPVNVAESGGHYTVALAGGRASLDRDFELVWRPAPDTAPRSMAFAETVDGDVHYLLMVMPPDTASVPPARMPREMIFVVDTSGSMHGASIAQARQALKRAVEGLASGDLFNIIEFNTHPTPLFARSMPANTPNLMMAQSFIGRLQANGGTEMEPALQLALRSPPQAPLLRQVVFITDGAVGNEEGLFRLIEAQLAGARLFTVGIGSAPNSWFMRKAAEAGRGTFTTISALNEVGEKMDRLFRKLEHPQLTDIRLEWPGNTAVEMYPAIVPDLYLGEPVSVRVRASGSFQPGARLRISGDSVAGAWMSEVPLAIEGRSPGVAALWARARIAARHDDERRGDDADTVRSDIVSTALRHHLVSRYTSLVAIDKSPARAGGEPLRKDPIANLVAQGQSAQAIFGFPATATNAAVLTRRGVLTLCAALLILAMGYWQRRVCRGCPV